MARAYAVRRCSPRFAPTTSAKSACGRASSLQTRSQAPCFFRRPFFFRHSLHFASFAVSFLATSSLRPFSRMLARTFFFIPDTISSGRQRTASSKARLERGMALSNAHAVEHGGWLEAECNSESRRAFEKHVCVRSTIVYIASPASSSDAARTLQHTRLRA